MTYDKESFIQGVIAGLRLGRVPCPRGPAPASVFLLTESREPIATETGSKIVTESEVIQ